MEMYSGWRMLAVEEKEKKIIEEAKKARKELTELENGYSYEKIAALRQVANDKHKLELRKKREKADYDKKVEEFKNSKGGGLKSWFGLG